MANVKSRIMAHNRKILNNLKREKDKKMCNCRIKNNCPVGGQCLQEKVVYRATVETKEEVKSYVGSAGNTFKERFNGHKSSFNYKTKRNTTALANYIWTLKERKTGYKLT